MECYLLIGDKQLIIKNQKLNVMIIIELKERETFSENAKTSMVLHPVFLCLFVTLKK
jgi:hypothetical protein